MINVSFGHERGCGAEAFFKSLLLLNQNQRNHFKLFVNKTVLINYLKDYGITPHFSEDSFKIWGTDINFHNVPKSVNPSSDSLLAAISETKNKDVLLTLPTSKDQLLFMGNQFNGHTELFRHFFKNNHITMNFINDYEKILLISDHIPLKNVPNITSDEIYEKVKVSLNRLKNIKQVCLSGINPHAGEAGLIGHEDIEVTKAIKSLSDEFTDIEFIGPLPGDSLHYYTTPQTLKVYMAHDQALSYFKGLYGINGANVSFGLPFIRLSVDHGTAFDLYAKNEINYLGSFYTLKLSLYFEG